MSEDDLREGMRGYRWLKAASNRQGYNTTARNFPERIVRRPVTVVSFEYEEDDEVNAIDEIHQPNLDGSVRVSAVRTQVYVDKLLTPVRYLSVISVRDEETDSILDFTNELPSRKNGTLILPMVFSLNADNRRWRLKLGEYRDDRFDEAPRDEQGRFLPVDRREDEEVE